jgi:hypothetical protein
LGGGEKEERLLPNVIGNTNEEGSDDVMNQHLPKVLADHFDGELSQAAVKIKGELGKIEMAVRVTGVEKPNS